MADRMVDKMTNSVRVRRYLNFHSLARKILCVDPLPPGAIARYEVDLSDDENGLSDVSCLIKRGKYEILTGEEAACTDPLYENQFYAPTFEHHIETDDEGYLTPESDPFSDDMTEEVFDKLKVQFLNKQEKLFLDLLKGATQRVDRYICCDTVEDAVEKIKKKDYKKLWIGKDFAGKDIVTELPNRQGKSYENLKGFILAHEDDPKALGYFTIRCDVCILPDIKNRQFVSFEDIAMFVVGKNLTYIEVKE